MKIKEILSSLREYPFFFPDAEKNIASLHLDLLEEEVTSIEHDSREVKPGSIFIAFEGTEYNSHQKIENARKNGATLVIGSDRSFEPDLLLGSSRAAIGPLSSKFKDEVSKKMSIVGITGTNGKTTVSYLYSNIIKALDMQCFTMGTTGVLLDGEKEADSQTTPDPILIHNFLSDFYIRGVLNGAVEVSSHALDQYRVLGVKFSAVAFTNFSQDHLDYHLNMEEYFEAKSKLFSKTYSDVAVVNIDDARGMEIVKRASDAGLKVIKVSAKNPEANIFVENKGMDIKGSRLKIHIIENNAQARKMDLHTTLVGDYNHENIAVALGLVLANGLDTQSAIDSLVNPELIPGRLQRVSNNRDVVVFIDYAHTPDALERVIKVIDPLAKKTIVVFGCGGDRDKTKRPIMGEIARNFADIAIVTNDNPRNENPETIIEEIVADHAESFIVISDRATAIQKAIELAQPGDAIIIAGKGHERGQIFADHTEDFSDLEVAKKIMESHIN